MFPPQFSSKRPSLREDLQLIVRGTDRAVVDPLRRDEQEIMKRVNWAIEEAGGVTRHRRISAGRMLPSGDVLLQADSLEDVERLTKACFAGTSNWCQVFGEDAMLKRHTYSVDARRHMPVHPLSL